MNDLDAKLGMELSPREAQARQMLKECITDSARRDWMQFLAKLHVETNWQLRREFPELIARLGDLDDRTKFPIGLRYCLDVAAPPHQLHPTVATGKTKMSPSSWQSVINLILRPSARETASLGRVVSAAAACSGEGAAELGLRGGRQPARHVPARAHRRRRRRQDQLASPPKHRGEQESRSVDAQVRQAAHPRRRSRVRQDLVSTGRLIRAGFA